jgi:hypothetical protein
MSDTKNGGEQDGSSPTFWECHSNRILGASALSVLMIGTVVYHLLEDWSWVDSFYFSSVAVTTVGFGDLAPSTDVSKLFTVFYIFGGLTIISVWLNTRLKHRTTKVVKKRGFTLASGVPVLPPNEMRADPRAAGPVDSEG